MLDNRKKRILQAIIDEYVETAEPVSSGSIANKDGLDYSSATIRNEMAELEKIGYLAKTHTSSGRVPSAMGYRLYVDELMKDDNLSLDEIKYIQSKLKTRVNEIEDLTKIATTTISEITHYTTISVAPKTNKQIIQEIKFVLLGTRMLMAVIITESGLIKETIIKYDEDIHDDQVQTLNNIFNSKLKGMPLEKINKPLEEYISSEINYSLNVIKPIIEQINKIIDEEEEKLYLQGANKSLQLPEFNNIETVKNFMDILEKKELMVDLLNSDLSKDINVYIGDELGKNGDLKDYSIITLKQMKNNKEVGTIGIIGPKRMDYAKVVSVMKYIKKLMEENGGE